MVYVEEYFSNLPTISINTMFEEKKLYFVNKKKHFMKKFRLYIFL